jgi:hypothetical protein
MLRPGLALELQPLPFLSLGAGYSAAYYFGPLEAQSYPSPRATYGSGVFSGPAAGPGGGYALLVHQLGLSGTLQGTLRRFAARTTTRAVRFFADLHGSDTVFYDPAFDVVLDGRGWVAQNDTDVVYSYGPGFVVGIRHSLTVAWYRLGAYAAGDPKENPNTPISRLGPLALYRFFDTQRGFVQRAELLVAAQWYLLHRYRSGETVNTAVPLVGIGLVLSGDLRPGR